MANETPNSPAPGAVLPGAPPPGAAPQRSAGNGKRRRAMFILGLVILLAALGYGIYWALIGRFYESTDDAYVSGNLVQITPQIAGTVISITADDTDLVKQGDTLV